MAAPRGRFAPSPTGRLHLGSLVTALASYLDVKSRSGQWLVRIEDVDQARTVPGAETDILRSLESLGLYWDGPITRQSERTTLYEDALQQLAARGLAYACSCTRSDLASLPRSPDGETIYPGLCRQGARPGELPPAWRFRTDLAPTQVEFADEWQGVRRQDVAAETGDFVIKRRDGFHAYQLAVVIDDAEQDIDRVVRGCDLLDNTPRQILLQRVLGFRQPAYAHVPLVVEPDGTKLSKSRRSVAAGALGAAEALHAALTLLRQPPPDDMAGAKPAELVEWAVSHWQPQLLAGLRSIQAPAGGLGSGGVSD